MSMIFLHYWRWWTWSFCLKGWSQEAFSNKGPGKAERLSRDRSGSLKAKVSIKISQRKYMLDLLAEKKCWNVDQPTLGEKEGRTSSTTGTFKRNSYSGIYTLGGILKIGKKEPFRIHHKTLPLNQNILGTLLLFFLSAEWEASKSSAFSPTLTESFVSTINGNYWKEHKSTALDKRFQQP